MKYYIYQLFTEPKPEQEWKKLLSFNFYNPPVPYACDLSFVNDRKRVLDRLRCWLKLYGLGDIKKSYLILSGAARKRYFKNRYSAFQEALKDLNTISIEQFISDTGRIPKDLFHLQDSFLSTSDCHFLLEDGRMLPVDAFFRSAEAKKPYYIGSIMEFRYVTPERV
ncbi:MAG: hypothetical protein IJN67_03770 [Oscillospiraceae bacterium]|nr:hypothetical protein [Oscillospiraceae bacterium]